MMLEVNLNKILCKTSIFLAAMSSSRSNVVTQCVYVFVRACFDPFFSLSVLRGFFLVLKSLTGV